VLVLSFAINKLSAGVATGLFIFYSALTGFTLSTLFFIYTASSIASTFFITSGTFAIVSAYGYFTKTDLTKFGNLMLMGLIGIIIASLVNFFLQSEAVMWAVTYIGVVVFVGLIAYDTQRIKRMANGLDDDGDVQRKAAVVGALALYLDFINLFLKLLRLLGQRR
jgi:FtsH-binding integral membrane protein